MSFSALINKNNISTGFNPLEGLQTGFFDVMEASNNMTELNYNSSSAAHASSEVSSDNQNLIDSLGLREEYKALREASGENRRSLRTSSGSQAVHDKAIMQGRAENPEVWNQIKTSAEIQEEARKLAQMSVEEYERVASLASGFDSLFGSLAGGVQGALQDPANIATLPVGAGAAKTLLSAMVREATIAMGLEAMTQPAVMDWQKELGQEYGLTDAATGVLTAGLIGGGAVPIMRGAKATNRMVLEAIATSERTPARIRAAAQSMARYQHVKDANPAGRELNAETEATHLRNTQAATKALDEGRPLDASEIDMPVVRPVGEAADTFDLEAETIKLREDELQQIKKELEQDLGERLSRGDRKRLQQERRQLQYELDRVSEVRAPAPQRDVPQRKAKQDAQRAEAKRLNDRIAEIDEQLEASKVGERARADISRIDQGIVPDRFQERIKSIQAERPAREMPDADQVDRVLEEEGLIPPRADGDQSMEIMREAEGDPAFQAAEADFSRMLDEMPDATLTLEDGTVRTYREIAEEFAEDENVMSALTTCGLGRG